MHIYTNKQNNHANGIVFQVTELAGPWNNAHAVLTDQTELIEGGLILRSVGKWVQFVSLSHACWCFPNQQKTKQATKASLLKGYRLILLLLLFPMFSGLWLILRNVGLVCIAPVGWKGALLGSLSRRWMMPMKPLKWYNMTFVKHFLVKLLLHSLFVCPLFFLIIPTMCIYRLYTEKNWTPHTAGKRYNWW